MAVATSVMLTAAAMRIARQGSRGPSWLSELVTQNALGGYQSWPTHLYQQLFKGDALRAIWYH
jgi:hypothetical protein